MNKKAKRGSNSLGDLDELLRRRAQYIAEHNRIYDNLNTWHIGIGKFRVRGTIGTNGIAIVFVVWHLLAGTVGVVLTLNGSKDLGIALVVGALFGFGAFLAQFWSQAMDTQREFMMKIEAEDDVKQLRVTTDRLAKVNRELDRRLSVIEPDS